MNTRERFLAVMDFEPVRTLKWEFGYWAATLRRWYGEGLVPRAGLSDSWPDGVGVHGGASGWRPVRPIDHDARQVCGLDEGMQRIMFNNYVFPPFEEQILEEHEDWLLVRNDIGMVEKRLKNRNSLPSFMQGPISAPADWEKFKAERLQPRLQDRLPANWDELKQSYLQRTFPLSIGGGYGFYSTLRFLFGEVQALTAFYDHPALVRQIIADLTDFWVDLYGQVLDQVDADLALIWEDMCYNRGPLISPATFRSFLLPGYQKLTRFLNKRGVRHIHVDTDGNIWKLIPLFIEGGVTGLYPFEVRAGMDIVDVRKAFPRLQILGGIDKAALAAGPAEIERELQARVPWMLAQGGFIPFVDHFVPPDVSWSCFYTYRTRLNQLIDAQAGLAEIE